MTFLKKILFFFFFVSLFFGCFTYHQLNYTLFANLQSGNYDGAYSALEKSSKKVKSKDALLHSMNRAYLQMLRKNHQESSTLFIEIDKNIEDLRKTIGDVVLMYFLNPSATKYRPEDYEEIMVNYFNSLNFLERNNYENALIECRRGLLKVYNLQDKYGKKNRYKDDAFFQNLIGMIYEATGKHNDAFIAYRNSLKVYQEFYSSAFSINVPENLKHDIIRSAYLTGFSDEVKKYEEQFGITYEKKESNTGNVIVLWNNGLAPFKGEGSINFVIDRNKGGLVFAAPQDKELNFSFGPSYVTSNQISKISDLSFMRVALPKLVDKKPKFTSAEITVNNTKKIDFQLAQDIEKIAHKSFKDRLVKELGNALIRLALKKTLEVYAESEVEGLGAAFSLLTAISEKADTRSWQTIPQQVFYSRFSLPEGKHILEIRFSGSTSKTLHVPVQVFTNETIFVPVFTPESY